MNTGLMSTKFFTDGINAVGPIPPKIPLPPFPSHLPLEKETLEMWAEQRELKLAILDQKPDSLALEQYILIVK